MQLNILNIKPVLVRYRRPLDEEHKFGWSDINPFTKKAWKGNLKEANQGFLSSWKSFGNNIKSIGKMALDDFQEDRKKHGLIGAAARNAWKMNPIGMIFNPKNTLKYAGALSRAGMDALGGTIGYAGLLIMPLKWEKAISENADYIDPTLWLNSGISVADAIVHRDRSRIMLPGQENGGFTNDRYWSWLGDKKMRLDLNDTANFAAAVYGVKGLKSGIKGMAKGEGIAGLDNINAARKAFNSGKELVSGWTSPSKWTMLGTGKAALKAGSVGLNAPLTIMPQYGLLNSPFSRSIAAANNSDFNINKDKYKYIIT